ncbi:MAG: 2-amino-4-hydroxy-6-hydroxymethyldihydropteridine diphosphokinase [Sphingobacteriales bacterium]|nr:MAG: 2-amino-4-hydroxy-6-hydroxymethyldihydropteridine diphosphokinase [Sphingobacteriales bacterium]
MNTAYLLLGSNEGDRLQWIYDALQQLDKHGLFADLSPVYETAAWGLEDQPSFLNVALYLQTALTAEQLLGAIQQIELNLGRQRETKWGQRTLDIDILFYNDLVIDHEDLKIPHPHLQERRFALTPLNDIAPELMHPVLTQTIATLLENCPDPLAATLYED